MELKTLQTVQVQYLSVEAIIVYRRLSLLNKIVF
jgi:hypothetical protein